MRRAAFAEIPLLAAAAALVCAGCTSGGSATAGGRVVSSAVSSPGPASSPAPSLAGSSSPAASAPTAHPSPVQSADAVIAPVPDSEWARIVAVGAWHAGCPGTQATLRRVEVNFHGFDGAVHRGVLVVNADVATEVSHVFSTLFDRGFPIHRMAPIEAYGGDDNTSMAADNTSAYNCRRASQANAPPTTSPHANGRAVDINPYENPWVDARCGCFEPDTYYSTHRTGRGVISKGGLVWSIFNAADWIWQDNASIDYQHFDTGYPSRPRS